jgi:hypothetical protein
MARAIVHSVLYVLVFGCGHADGLRVEWNEVPSTHASRTESEPLVEEEPLETEEDVYALMIGPLRDPVIDVTFYDPSDGSFTLTSLECMWQGRRCVGRMPYEARRSHYFTVDTVRHLCPDVRLYRNGLEIDLERYRLRSCAFLMEADPD